MFKQFRLNRLNDRIAGLEEMVRNLKTAWDNSSSSYYADRFIEASETLARLISKRNRLAEEVYQEKHTRK